MFALSEWKGKGKEEFNGSTWNLLDLDKDKMLFKPEGTGHA